jgi:hypothetical protein
MNGRPTRCENPAQSGKEPFCSFCKAVRGIPEIESRDSQSIRDEESAIKSGKRLIFPGNIPQFFDECCIVDRERAVLVKHAYDRYVRWCKRRKDRKIETLSGNFCRYVKTLKISGRPVERKQTLTIRFR